MLDLHRLVDHLAWADARVLEVLQSTPEPASVRLFAHLLAADRVWLSRLRREDSSALPIWPELTVEDCAELASAVRVELAEFVSGLPVDSPKEPVRYRNSKGDEFTSSVGDILTHIVMHGSYHRGQIASRLRDAGGEPVNTDFITFARERPPSRASR